MSAHRILVIDDQPEMLEAFRRVITYMGHYPEIVDYARDRARIDSLLTQYRFSLCFLDLWLEDPDAMQERGLVPEKAQDLLHRLERLGVPTIVMTRHWNHRQPADEWLEAFSAAALNKDDVYNHGPEAEDGLRQLIAERLADAIRLMAAEGMDPAAST